MICPVGVIVSIVKLLIAPDPGLLSFRAITAPAKVLMLVLLIVPAPAAVIDEPESAVPTVMPEIVPVETVPVDVMLLIDVLLITPEPAFESSGAVNDPASVPMLTLLVVPWPAAVIDEPESALPTVMPEMLPVDTVPVDVMLLIVVLLITPEPALLSSGAVKVPPNVPMLTLLVVPWPAAVMDEPDAAVPTVMPE